jgi:hypothetical protein
MVRVINTLNDGPTGIKPEMSFALFGMFTSKMLGKGGNGTGAGHLEGTGCSQYAIHSTGMG